MKYLSILVICFVFMAIPARADERRIYGVFEKATLPEVSSAAIEAKLDTGAITTSLGADGIELFEKDGQDWVRFTPQVEGAVQMERPLARYSRIKVRADEGGAGISQRPVIVLDVCLGDSRYSLEVNLTDRSNFNCPLLLGRTALREFGALIDPAGRYLSTENCR